MSDKMHVRVELYGNSPDKIRAIKQLRTMTAMGLKEAKEVMDEVHRTGSHVAELYILTDEDLIARGALDRELMMAEFETFGYRCTTPNHGSFIAIMKEIKQLIARAIDKNHFDLAKKLIDVVAEYSTNNPYIFDESMTDDLLLTLSSFKEYHETVRAVKANNATTNDND